jgi:hypothetical protein
VTDAVLSAVTGGVWALAMAAVFDRHRRGLTSDADTLFFLGGAAVGVATQAWLRRRQ